MTINLVNLEQIKDCDHCSKTYGTLGCCTTVNNKWVYSCTEGQKEYIIGRVLESIDDWKMEGIETITMNGSAYEHHVETLKKMVLALRGGDF